MAVDTILIIIGIILLITGVIGSIFPVLPGPPIAYVSLLLLQWTSKAPYETTQLVIIAVVVVVVAVLDYVVPVWGTKKFGGSKYGTWGSTIGVVAGLFIFPPFGVIIGPFFGALIGELIGNKPFNEALRAAFGSFIGFITGVFMKLALCGFLVYYFIKGLI